MSTMALARFRQLFPRSSCAVIGMIHVHALPGTPLHRHSVEEIVKKACKEADIYHQADVDGVLIENMFDLPYLRGGSLGPEVVASMTRVCHAVRAQLPSTIPCGIQILAGGNHEAVAVGQACGLQFVRAECFVFSHVADEGLMDGCAGPLLRYRQQIGAPDLLLFTDIKKKHSAHAITADVSTVDAAQAAQFFLADGVILTGSATGQEASMSELHDVVDTVALPVLVGSGVTQDNVHRFLAANGLIVGSHFKTQGKWTGELEPSRVEAFMQHVRSLQSPTATQ